MHFMHTRMFTEWSFEPLPFGCHIAAGATCTVHARGRQVDGQVLQGRQAPSSWQVPFILLKGSIGYVVSG